jgi:hypothetical protein
LSAAIASAPTSRTASDDDKDADLAEVPFKALALNEVWLEIVLLADDLIVWTQALLLGGRACKGRAKRLRYRLPQVAPRLVFDGRRARLRLRTTGPEPPSWPRLQKLKALPAVTG